MTIVLRFFPDGQFSQGNSFPRKRDKLTHPLESYIKRRDDYGNAEIEWQARKPAVKQSLRDKYIGEGFISAQTSRIYMCSDVCADMKPTMIWYDDAGAEHTTKFDVPIGVLLRDGAFAPLGLSDAPILEKTAESRKKLLSITKNMARNLRNATYILESQYGKDLLSFLTLTIPSLPTEDMNKICADWGRLTNEILKWLKYQVEKKGCDFEYTYCTEIQEQRLEKKGEYAPHLHIVFRGRSSKKNGWFVSPTGVRKAWLRLLSGCVGYSVKSRSVENIQRIKRSAARYLSKYLSKGCGERSIAFQRETGMSLHCQWGGMSRKLSQALKAATVTIGTTRATEDIALVLFRCLGRATQAGIIAKRKDYSIRLDKHGDSRYSRYLKATVGFLARGLDKGGLTDLLKFAYEDYDQIHVEDLLNALDMPGVTSLIF
jgi:hypothetical protein